MDVFLSSCSIAHAPVPWLFHLLKAVRCDCAKGTTNQFVVQCLFEVRSLGVQEIMQEPVVAADGVSYERKAIEDWFTRSNCSPMTGSPYLPA